MRRIADPKRPAAEGNAQCGQRQQRRRSVGEMHTRGHGGSLGDVDICRVRGKHKQCAHVKALALAGDINIEGTTVAIALPKGSELVKPVQAALNSLIADGSYQKILDGWDIGFGAVKTAGINEEIAK